MSSVPPAFPACLSASSAEVHPDGSGSDGGRHTHSLPSMAWQGQRDREGSERRLLIGGVIYQTKFWLRGSREWNAGSHAISLAHVGHASPSPSNSSSAQTDVVPKRAILYPEGGGARARAERGVGLIDWSAMHATPSYPCDKWQWSHCVDMGATVGLGGPRPYYGRLKPLIFCEKRKAESVLRVIRVSREQLMEGR